MARTYGYESYGRWAPYVPVAERRRKAQAEVQRRAKKGQTVSPVEITGRGIASTFWGKAWCDNLESYSDYANRLPRGRTYVRNGSVVDLQIGEGRVKALVSGSSLYKVDIQIEPLPGKMWQEISAACAGQIGSLVELLAGKLQQGVMAIMTDPRRGLFPAPQQIKMTCSCPDWATMCKHVAAVLYGVGARLDQRPELLFTLRGIDHRELIVAAGKGLGQVEGEGELGDADLGALFGIEMDAGDAPAARAKVKTPAKAAKTKAKTPAKAAKAKVKTPAKAAKAKVKTPAKAVKTRAAR